MLSGHSAAKLTSHSLPTPLWPPFRYLSPSATQHPTVSLVHQSPKMIKSLSPVLLTTPSSFENYKPPFCPVLKTTRHLLCLVLPNPAPLRHFPTWQHPKSLTPSIPSFTNLPTPFSRPSTTSA